MLNFEKILLDINQRKPYLTLVKGDFNGRYSSWWSDDIDTTEGTKLLSLKSCNGFQQIINEPTHIQRQSSSCIDLIFMDQANISVNSGIHTSLHPNCHHQIVQSKFKLNISYPPPYKRLVWNYKKADVPSTRKALDSVNWEKLLRNKKIDIQVSIFNETILKIFRNFVPNKIITCSDIDPVWMNEKIKSKVKSKNQLYKVYIKNGRNGVDFLNLKNSIAELNELVSTTRTSYYKNLGKKLNDPNIQTKSYWTILKSFHNNKKIPLIPLLLINDKFATDIKTKANIFNKFFFAQCTPLKKDSVLPTS